MRLGTGTSSKMSMKVSKRDFVKAGAAVVVATASKAAITMPERAATGSDDTGIPRAPSFDLAVFNDLFPQARAFAAELSAQGTRALPIAGDAGRLWYDTLRGLVANDRRSITGLTTHTDLLILETLAREKGLRVTQREPAGRLLSWILL